MQNKNGDKFFKKKQIFALKIQYFFKYLLFRTKIFPEMTILKIN